MSARQYKMQRHRAGDGGTHWISYSDMMASLLLIFILAIVLSIYNYYQLLETKTKELGEQQAQLDAAQITLAQQEKDLETTRVTLMGKEEELAAIQIQLDTKEQDLNAATLKLSEREEENEKLLAQIVLREADLADQQNRIDALQLVLAEQEKELSSYQVQIADLLGVRTRIVEELSIALSRANISATVDKTTGYIVLESTLMFEFGKSEISDAGKAQLDRLMPVYLGVLMSPEYKDYVAEIIIEGHTDSTGTYAGNLKLSQERALSVVNYCQQMKALAGYPLQKLITAQGRANANPILRADGSEDKDRSRRVEIKFRLKDTEMIERMGQVLSGLE